MACFNSQRDGILPHFILLGIEIYTCFNSQRDGILQYTLKNGDVMVLFQFPTGWNSTFAFCSKSGFIGQFQFPTGWNSTKLYLSKMINTCAFQFPTGWNSTFLEAECKKTVKSFNSQRDGILQYRLCSSFSSRKVSIPNGMEFYSLHSPAPWAIKSVSIPNGMEFYYYNPLVGY